MRRNFNFIHVQQNEFEIPFPRKYFPAKKLVREPNCSDLGEKVRLYEYLKRKLKTEDRTELNADEKLKSGICEAA